MDTAGERSFPNGQLQQTSDHQTPPEWRDATARRYRLRQSSRSARVGLEALRTQLARIRDFSATGLRRQRHRRHPPDAGSERRLRTMAHLLETTPAFRRKRVHRLRKQLQPLAERPGREYVTSISCWNIWRSMSRRPKNRARPTSRTAVHDDILQRREKALNRLRKTLQSS